VRVTLGEKRVGHAGTLDPMATGLLVLGVGSSTRLLRFAQGEVKRYRGTVLLGVATDSLDAQGAVTQRRTVPDLTPDRIEAAVEALRGAQLQVPPMVSALKVGGRRLHELARRGVEVERDARAVTISEFSVAASDERDRFHFEVQCSPGTYVRVLLSDFAESLGTVGHLTSLRRISSGAHTVDQAHTLEQIDAMVREGETVLRPPIDFVAHLAHVVVTDDQERRLRMGQRIMLNDRPDGDEVAAVNARGALVAILRPREEQWKPELVVGDDAAGTSD